MNTEKFQPPRSEHPFAPFIRILGKGKTGTRSLDSNEARQALEMILRGEVEPVQLGAFLMLLRVKEESEDELAGFVSASRRHMRLSPPELKVDLDWSSYAGKRNQHPWYVLSQLLLAQSGYRILVHGSDGHTPGRLYTEEVYRALGLPVAIDWKTVERGISSEGLVYLPLRHLCKPLHDIMQLRDLLGLRSPVNTLSRMLNPLRAPCSIQSVFHPTYARLHLATDAQLGQPNTLVFKGESGEVEIKPHATTRLDLLRDGQTTRQVLARRLDDRVERVNYPDWKPVAALWLDTVSDSYGLEAVLSTTTAALLLLETSLDAEAARAQSLALWHARDKQKLRDAVCH